MPSYNCRRRWSPGEAERRHGMGGEGTGFCHSAATSPAATSSNGSTVPIAELVREAPTTNVANNAIERCVYFTPPTAHPRQPQKGLRRLLFFGDSPPASAPPHPPPSSRRPPPFFPFLHHPSQGAILPLDEAPHSPLAALRAGRSMLGGAKRRNHSNLPLLLAGSHSSRTVSLDFDSESTGTTVPAEEISPPSRHKCNGSSGGQQQKQKGGPTAAFRHSQQMPFQQQDSPPSAGAHPTPQRRQRPTPPFSGGSQFDTQSLQARRSRSFAAQHQQMSSYPNGGTPSSAAGQHHHSQQQQQPVVRCGSCSNLSMNGGAGGQLVLYEGNPIGHHQAESTQRHSMILPMDPAQLCAPLWYQPIMPPPPPPPPFYYNAATLPHPVAPMDYKSFKQAMKDSERFEKKQRKMMLAEIGEDTFGSACCQFCCGGSALILWLVISLVALGFLGFLLLAIYFV